MRVFISRKKYSPVAREQALDRAGAAVPDRARGLDGDRADPLAQRVVDRRRRRLLDELLVAALDRAVALAEMDDVAVRVGEHLHLDVPRVLEVPLDVDGRVGEVRLAFAPGGLERALGLVGVAHDLQALAAAARRRLDRDRPAELVAEPAHLVGGLDRLGVTPGMIGTPAARIRSRASIFEPIASIASGGGPIQTSPASAQARAKAAFSARKP